MPGTPFSAHPGIVRVALPTPLRRLFDYRCPDRSPAGGWQAGIRVRVPFGHRQVVGVVIELADSSALADHQLKPVSEIIDDTPLPADWLWLCRFTARYYQHGLGETLNHAMPARLRQGFMMQGRTQTLWRFCGPPSPDVGRARRQAELLALLQQHPSGLASSVIRAHGFSHDTLTRLAHKGLIEAYEVARHPAKDPSRQLLATPALPLNQEQAAALAAIHERLDTFHPCLIEGVTGSGKTEVYLQLIEAMAAKGRQSLVLVPEIGLTPQTLARFRQRFNLPIAALHSGLGDAERLDAWEAAASGRALIIIGTRSAIFTPLAAPGVIIVDEEHDSSYKQHEGLRYHARDLAMVRAKYHNIPVVLGTATVSLETLRHGLDGDYRHLILSQRASPHPPARMELVDLRHQRRQGGLLPASLAAITQTLDKGRQALIFINRRGFAPALACHACGWMADCHQCDARLTLHRQPPLLACHHCDQRRALPDACPDCDSGDLRALGSGTERTEETLQALYPQTPVHRIDRDSTRRKDSFEQIMQTVQRGEPCLLVGTQMLAKGHHLPHVTLVVVLNADGGLYAADFRAMEHSAQLLEQVAGRAGRAADPGRVLIQTLHPQDPHLKVLATQGYPPLARQLLEDRRSTGLPPFGFMALLRIESPDSALAKRLAGQAEKALREWIALHQAQVRCLGPVPAPMERRQNRYHLHLMLNAEQRSRLHPAVSYLIHWLETSRDARRLRWSMDIDPLTLT